MTNTAQKNDKGNELSTKWIYVIIIALALGLGIYGYFTVKKWIRYAAVERYEKPITDYTITKVYTDLEKARQKPRRGATDNDDVEEQEPNYYMEVLYKDKEYKLEIEKYDYDKIKNKTSDITLYYDAQGDEVFVAGTGGGNLFVTILAAIAILIVVIFVLIRLLFKSIKKKRLKM